METTTQNLNSITNTINFLEERLNEQLTANELSKLAQDAADSYHQLAAVRFRSKQDVEKIALLLQRLSTLEQKLQLKFYRPKSLNQKRSIL